MKISHEVKRKNDGYEAIIAIYNEHNEEEPAVYSVFEDPTAKGALTGARLKMLALFEKAQSRAINRRIEVGALLLKLNPNEYNEKEVTNG